MIRKIAVGFALIALGTGAAAADTVYDGVSLSDYRSLVNQMGIQTVARATSQGTPYFAMQDNNGNDVVLFGGMGCKNGPCQGFYQLLPMTSVPSSIVKQFNAGVHYAYVVDRDGFMPLQLYTVALGGVNGTQIQNTVAAFMDDAEMLAKLAQGVTAQAPSASAPALTGAARWQSLSKALTSARSSLGYDARAKSALEAHIDTFANTMQSK